MDLKQIIRDIEPLLDKIERLFLEGYNNTEIKVYNKSSQFDLVTVYDKKIEEIFCNEILKIYPNHRIIGEESTFVGNVDKLTSHPTWIIDPIDGTTNFINSIPFCCISIALSIDKEIVLGIVSNPIMKQTFKALKGHGAFLNNKRINCTGNVHLEKCVFITEKGYMLDNAKLEIIKMAGIECLALRCMGSAALNMCYVAAGYADAYWEIGIHVWDIAAGSLIATESGAIVSNVDGSCVDILSRKILVTSSEQLKETIVLKTLHVLDKIIIERDGF